MLNEWTWVLPFAIAVNAGVVIYIGVAHGNMIAILNLLVVIGASYVEGGRRSLVENRKEE